MNPWRKRDTIYTAGDWLRFGLYVCLFAPTGVFLVWLCGSFLSQLRAWIDKVLFSSPW